MIDSHDPLEQARNETSDAPDPLHRQYPDDAVVEEARIEDFLETDSDNDQGQDVDDDTELVDDIPVDTCMELADDILNGVGDRDEEDPDGVIGHEDIEHDKPDEDVERSPKDLAEFSYVDDDGYIVCTVPPYASHGTKQIGRIATWPKEKPENERSVSISCFLHGGCKPKALRRWQVTDATLMEWLYTGKFEHPCTHARKVDLRKEHMSTLPSFVD